MFTGIVEELGTLLGRHHHRFTFAADHVLDDAKTGSSIAVDGCCLTVVDLGPGWWSAEVVDETLSRTTLGELAVGEPFNLVGRLGPTDRLGGHVVQGHVDGVGQVTTAAPDLAVRPPPALLRYLVEKGSVAVDGCSLTVAHVDDAGFGVAVIPHTAAVTTLGRRRPGDRVNLEVDLLAKYVEKLTRGT
jgi:riboflavin synthase